MTGAGDLIRLAAEARLKAYAPYSHFMVGAALLCADGEVYTGCNIENAAYSPSICAERCAFARAVSEGERDFTAIAVVGARDGESPDKPCYPCGVCRQVMQEFCDPETFMIYLCDGDKINGCRLQELLPAGFTL